MTSVENHKTIELSYRIITVLNVSYNWLSSLFEIDSFGYSNRLITLLIVRDFNRISSLADFVRL